MIFNLQSTIYNLQLLHPRPALRAAHDRLDHRHIRHRILDRRGHRRIVQDRARQRIALERILIAYLEHNLIGAIGVLVPDLAWPVGRRGSLDDLAAGKVPGNLGRSAGVQRV